MTRDGSVGVPCRCRDWLSTLRKTARRSSWYKGELQNQEAGSVRVNEDMATIGECVMVEDVMCALVRRKKYKPKYIATFEATSSQYSFPEEAIESLPCPQVRYLQEKRDRLAGLGCLALGQSLEKSMTLLQTARGRDLTANAAMWRLVWLSII